MDALTQVVGEEVQDSLRKDGHLIEAASVKDIDGSMWLTVLTSGGTAVRLTIAVVCGYCGDPTHYEEDCPNIV